MKPEQFIREYRVEKAREVVANQPKMNATQYRAKDKKYSSLFKPSPEIVYVADLKRLVESIDLVESWGGIEDLKLYDLSHCKDKPESAGYKLLKAIADYESIYGGGESHAN
ncbi:hypothetical protein V7I38_18820 [Acinetobacter baumannii]|nr:MULTISPECIES: hypothetical protein [Acinetobacter]ATR87165.1 hypothetical protein CTI08_07615 [Acinetobacter baumannii]AYX91608.1 hypothetical protein EG365_02320 [Acinetobacter sp. FDAARGOS_494]AZK37108.1 hypothetical protein EI069_05560 [Acinetobacter baumannii]AZK40765.1 hypothetical protein EI070_05560 [Acinetobacter baumannii]EHU1263587.1 hypothetical protein [Acinetobacter baumannii]